MNAAQANCELIAKAPLYIVKSNSTCKYHPSR